jgi:DNA helicase HerA-like ATPase
LTEETTKFYFAKAHEYGATGIISKETPKLSNEPPPGSDIVDLASLPDNNTRYLVTNSILAEELESQTELGKNALVKGTGEMNDTRVPIFLLLDEAHNFVPEEPCNRVEEALRDQFRTIAAEGRKYGVFLILVCQRPDKLDHLILPECANKAIMRLDSRTIPQLVRGKNWVCRISTLICWRKQFSSERAGY